MAYGLDTSQMLQAFGQLQQSNAAMRQRKDAAAAKRRGGISAITSTAGTVIGGMYGGPMGAAVGGAIGKGVGGMMGGNAMTAQDAAQSGMQIYGAAKAQEKTDTLKASNASYGDAAKADATPVTMQNLSVANTAQDAAKKGLEDYAARVEADPSTINKDEYLKLSEAVTVAAKKSSLANIEAQKFAKTPKGKESARFNNKITGLNLSDPDYVKKVDVYKKEYGGLTNATAKQQSENAMIAAGLGLGADNGAEGDTGVKRTPGATQVAGQVRDDPTKKGALGTALSAAESPGDLSSPEGLDASGGARITGTNNPESAAIDADTTDNNGQQAPGTEAIKSTSDVPKDDSFLPGVGLTTKQKATLSGLNLKKLLPGKLKAEIFKVNNTANVGMGFKSVGGVKDLPPDVLKKITTSKPFRDNLNANTTQNVDRGASIARKAIETDIRGNIAATSSGTVQRVDALRDGIARAEKMGGTEGAALIEEYNKKVATAEKNMQADMSNEFNRTAQKLYPGIKTESMSPEQITEVQNKIDSRDVENHLKKAKGTAIIKNEAELDSPMKKEMLNMLAKQGVKVTPGMTMRQVSDHVLVGELSASQETKNTDMDAMTAIANTLNTNMNNPDLNLERYVGPIAGYRSAASAALGWDLTDIANVGGRINPHLSDMMANTAFLKNRLVFALTGKQMNEKERGEIIKQIPTPTDPIETWKSKMKLTLRTLKMMKDIPNINSALNDPNLPKSYRNAKMVSSDRDKSTLKSGTIYFDVITNKFRRKK